MPQNEDALTPGPMFRALRKRSGLTQEQLAADLGIPNGHWVSNREIGKAPFTLEDAVVLANRLKMTDEEWVRLRRCYPQPPAAGS